MKKILGLIAIVTLSLLGACNNNDTNPAVEEDTPTSEQGSLKSNSDLLSSDEHSDLDPYSNLQSLVTFTLDHEAFFETVDWSVVEWDDPESIPQNPVLTATIIREIANLPYVEASEYSMSAWAESKELYNYIPGIGAERWTERTFFQLRGTSEAELFPITASIIELVSGRTTFTPEEMNDYTEINPAIVSEEFANANNLSVGSTFTLDVVIRSPYPDDDDFNWEWELSDESIYAERSFSFNIIGTFKTLESTSMDVSDDPWEWGIEDGIRSSISTSIHVPNVVIEEMMMFQNNTWNDMVIELELEAHDEFWMDIEPAPQIESLMILRSSSEVKNFETAVLDILPEFFIVEDVSTLMTERESS